MVALPYGQPCHMASLTQLSMSPLQFLRRQAIHTIVTSWCLGPLTELIGPWATLQLMLPLAIPFTKGHQLHPTQPGTD